ncbi:1,2-dihydroxy-3-keto-5-methylthiopentene dioxygenase [Neophaeococcomyces mojaviensis]|uniref:1,2-dihydroxy-3-keto-5-methylthiopentene dioxygenase n=1 Tax=Neophaeococcomyces mojaviensis TaxID=3383035 RepID=A0ACC2ZZ79_9EURO|nr:1,2-dihydroxy-3-keto-5-methylthiopentene dioxygenase [Knufia sp. JES_112]
MAWQNAGGGPGVGAMGAETSGVQAYTLQGVMRFLQTEWHRHERERNAWDIEREEMKKRIAGLEGESRSSKSLRTVLERQIRMLEHALRKERETISKLKKGEHVDLSKDSRELAREEIEKLKEAGKIILPKTISQFDNEIDAENHLSQGIRQEKQRDMSKAFLNQCSTEVSYHILPGAQHKNENLDLPSLNHVTGERQPTNQELHEAYIQIQAQKQQQHRENMAMVRENPMSSQHSVPAYSDPAPLARSTTQINHAQMQTREMERKLQDQPLVPSTKYEAQKQFSVESLHPQEEQVESVTHSYDGYGRQVPNRDENLTPQSAHKNETDVSDGWDFDDAPPPTHPPPDFNSLQRPDTEAFPSSVPSKSPTRLPGSHRRRSSGARRKSAENTEIGSLTNSVKADASQFKVRFAMRGHLDVVRSVTFTGGGSPADPEFCTASDDGTIKRWHVPASYGANSLGEDVDRIAHFTHRGHIGAVCSLAACPATHNFANGGRAMGDGWIFSGGEDASVKVWERGRVDAKASLEGHTDAVWALCVLPGTAGSILGDRSASCGGPDRILLAAGAADGTILIWAVSTPPQVNSVSGGSNRGTRGSRRANSISAGSNFPNSPQPSIASNTPFNYTLVHRIKNADHPSPTSISPLSPGGESFVVGYSNASILVFDTRTGEEIVGMASQETYDGTPNTGVNAVVASSSGFDTRESVVPARRGSMGDDDVVHGATGGESGVEGVVIAGYEDRYIRFFDANSGQCTYTMLAHPSAISTLSLSPDGRELVSGGHDASLRFWSLEKRNCTQEITSHRIMRGEGVCSVVWSPDGRWVISAGGDGAVKVFSRA